MQMIPTASGLNPKMRGKSLAFRQRHGKTTATSALFPSRRSAAKSTSTAPTSTLSSENIEFQEEKTINSKIVLACEQRVRKILLTLQRQTTSEH